MPRGVDDRQRGARDLDLLPVGEIAVAYVGMGVVPQHVVAGMQQDRCTRLLRQLRCDGDVVVVPVGQQDRLDGASADRVEDRRGLVRRVDDDDLAVVTDDPDVVVDVPGAAVEAESA